MTFIKEMNVKISQNTKGNDLHGADEVQNEQEHKEKYPS